MQLYTIDLKFQRVPQTIASYVLRHHDAVVLIETGPASIIPQLENGLATLGLRPSHVTHALLTHIHLDHAGAAWWLAMQGVPIYVHHVGAPHLASPERLWASASRIYGERMDALWGEMKPIAPQQIRTLFDGDVIDASGLPIVALDTPGHAAHHLSFFVEGLLFSGDVAATRHPNLQHVRCPTPPPEFDYETWTRSIARIRSFSPRILYLTHFGPVEQVESHLNQVSAHLNAMTNLVENAFKRGFDRAEVIAKLQQFFENQLDADDGSVESNSWYELLMPTFMSADGLLRYWKTH